MLMLKSLRSKLSGKQKGFTIIEVMIVLAIAGLIMVVVFIAVPQLQSSSRDSRRKDLLARLNTEIERYQSNNGGKYPFEASGTSHTIGIFCTKYITDTVNITDPSSDTAGGCGGATNVNVIVDQTGTSITTPVRGTVVISRGAKCDGESATRTGVDAANNRQYAIVIALDKAGTFACVSNG
jgi:prepilin-type N-terminal cleavage/methylation domain-containing protein